ncbi:MAG: hypothetical protein IPP61_11935 [Cytophagaceae bacterium]|nr:hypothetical protein [Cytophagaceae bacterium]
MLDPDYIWNYRIEEYKTSKLRRKLHQKLTKQQTKSSDMRKRRKTTETPSPKSMWP